MQPRSASTPPTEYRRHLVAVAAVVAAALTPACGSTPDRPAAPTQDGHTQHAAAPAGDTQHAAPQHQHGNHGQAGMHHRFADAEEWAKVFDDPERDAWQRPEEVLRVLELEPAMTVADIGAGTGYFAVRLARAVPEGEVIATDVEPDMVRYLEERARREQLDNLRALQSPHASSGLAEDSVDRILIVDVWHHLDDRVDYARDLAAAIRPGGKLVIVDYELSAQRGPPKEFRLAPEALIAELEAAGWTAKVAPVELPHQYVIEARPGR